MARPGAGTSSTGCSRGSRPDPSPSRRKEPLMNATKTSAKRTTPKSEVLSPEEIAALKETVKERKAARGGRTGKADGEADVLAKIAEMPKSDRDMAERIHAIVKASAPALAPKTWYGMPAYANEDGKV